MAELEDQLNRILSDPDAMGRILTMAKALTGSPEEVDAPAEALREETGGSSDLSEEDSRFPRLALEVLTAYQSENGRGVQLLRALRPFLKESRRAGLEEAERLARLAGAAAAALRTIREEWKGGRDSV